MNHGTLPAYNAGCCCAECLAAGRAVNHGTSSSYNRHGCRCVECREAKLLAVKRWRDKQKPAPTVPDLSWMDAAACKGQGTDQWFAEGRHGNSAKKVADACAVCATCPVARQCLDYALTECIGHGVWGGTTPKERAAMRRGAA